jgi:LysM repeat protein
MKRITVCVLACVALLAVGVAPALAQATTHVVQPGENLFRIALRYGVSVDSIMAANNLTNPNFVYSGQVLTIPSGDAPVTPAAWEAGSATHVVAPGETLLSLARRYGVSVDVIMGANSLRDPNVIYSGQALTIPGGAAQPEAAAPAAPAAAATHTVAPGENMFRIALRYGVSVEALATANGIVNPNQLYAGQTLVIPSGPGAALPPTRPLLNVPIVRQSRNLTCESASACSLMRYHGYACAGDMSVLNALPRSYDNPHRGYVGNPDMLPGSLPPGAAPNWVGGYGVYTEALSQGLANLGVPGHYQYFASLDTLRSLLDQGIPPLIIATHGMGAHGYQPSLFTPVDGDGGTVTVIRYEHSYVLSGYDSSGFWAVDPWTGSVEYFTNARLDGQWALLGRQVLWIAPY